MSVEVVLHQAQTTLSVQGAIVLETVPKLEQALRDIQPPIEKVELSRVTHVDSSALAWLISLCGLTQTGVSPKFLNPPKNLRMLAQLYELDFLDFDLSDA